MVRKNKKSDVELWDFETELEVSTGVAVDPKRARWRRFYKFYAISGCVLFPLASLFAVAGWEQASGSAPAVSAPMISSPAKGAATKAVTDWLKAVPAPVPDGTVQSWDGFKNVPVPASTDGTPVPTYEIHSFTIVSSTGRLYTSTVEMAYSNTSGVQVVGTPSLIPFAPDGGTAISTNSPWPGHEVISTSKGIQDAVGVWAAAFTGGNPSALRQTVGDPNSVHAYVPFAGIQQIKNVSVTGVASNPTSDETKNKVKTPAEVVARVTFEVLWVNQVSKDGSSISKVTYDVLIDRANTGSPVVVAWGGPGEGYSLSPYSNALTRSDIKVEDPKSVVPVTPASSPSTAPTAANSTSTTTPKADASK